MELKLWGGDGMQLQARGFGGALERPRQKVGELYEILSADSVTGRFSNADDRVRAGDGTELRVGYEAGRVTLKVVPPLQLSSAE